MIAMFKKNSWKWPVIAVILLIAISLICLTSAGGVTGADSSTLNSNKTADEGATVLDEQTDMPKKVSTLVIILES